MANLNKVILIGRLTRDPEVRAFSNGGKVVKFGFAVTNRKKNTQTGQWEDEPMFIDCEAFNRGESGTLANIIEERCRKGSQICIEARLHLDQWDDKASGAKRSKHKLVVETMQLLDRREDGTGGGEGGGGYSSAPARSAPAGRSSAPAARSSTFSNDDGPDNEPAGSGEEIPF
jgi:single-strand DNA-binding protein